MVETGKEFRAFQPVTNGSSVHAFFRYVQYEHPERTALCQQVLFLKFAKAPKTELNYMSVEGIQALLAIPEYGCGQRTTRIGNSQPSI